MTQFGPFSFEVSPSGTTLTAGNTGLDVINTANMKSDSGWSESGSFSAKMILSAANCQAQCNITSGSSAEAAVQALMSQLPSANTFILGFRASGSVSGGLRCDNAGVLTLRDGSTTRYTFSTTIVAGTEYFFECRISGSTCRGWIYDSNGALVEDSGSKTWASGNVDQAFFGSNVNITVNSISFDRFIVNDTATFIGPANLAQNLTMTIDDPVSTPTGVDSFFFDRTLTFTDETTLRDSALDLAKIISLILTEDLSMQEDPVTTLSTLMDFTDDTTNTDQVLMTWTRALVPINENLGLLDTLFLDLVVNQYVQYTGTIEDQAFAWLGALGFSGTLEDRQYAFLATRYQASFGPPLSKLTTADMQKALGKKIRDVLDQHDWV